MPVTLRVTATGLEQLKTVLSKIDRTGNRTLLTRFLLRSALRVQTIAAQDMIIRGGAKGAPANPTMLTSRTGALRRSISVDQAGVPTYIDVGSDLVYAAVHELGGTFSQNVKAHDRRIAQAFGHPVTPHTVHVNAFHRTLRMPRRPFLGPALDKAAQEFEALLEQSLAEQVES